MFRNLMPIVKEIQETPKLEVLIVLIGAILSTIPLIHNIITERWNFVGYLGAFTVLSFGIIFGMYWDNHKKLCDERLSYWNRQVTELEMRVRNVPPPSISLRPSPPPGPPPPRQITPFGPSNVTNLNAEYASKVKDLEQRLATLEQKMMGEANEEIAAILPSQPRMDIDRINGDIL